MKYKLLIILIILIYSVITLTCPVPSEEEKIIIIRENINLRQYTPFSAGNKLARLPAEASLKLTENLPILDGATALYPVYASFAQAVYPSTENYNLSSLYNILLRHRLLPAGEFWERLN